MVDDSATNTLFNEKKQGMICKIVQRNLSYSWSFVYIFKTIDRKVDILMSHNFIRPCWQQPVVEYEKKLQTESIREFYVAKNLSKAVAA